MIKAAIEKIQSMTAPTIREFYNRNFVITNDGEIKEISYTPDYAETLTLNSLDALEKLVKTEAIPKYAAYTPIYITVPTPTQVNCFTQPYLEKALRPLYYVAKATDVPGWSENTQLKFEEAMIALRTRFQETVDTTYTLKLLSDISTGSKVTYNDNGIATSVITKTGISLQSNEAIKPIVSLKPYRTFQEVEQPTSQFLIRINERGINFVEADGGMWKLAARNIIKEYLYKAFKDEIEKGTVVIAL